MTKDTDKAKRGRRSRYIQTIFIAIALVLFSFSISVGVTGLFGSEKTIVHTGILKFADNATIFFEDGEIYTSQKNPLFFNETISSDKIHLDYRWFTEKPLVKGLKYTLVARVVKAWWLIPIRTGAAEMIENNQT